ncbi:MAG: PIG-L family deacetylase [Chloroflexota bacterium]|nr:PIG-L family deacetylase [Chloroflexota bacterium]
MQAETTPGKRTFMAVFAHPDDESFGTAGTFAALTRAGGRVMLVCATRGEVGEISDPALATPETLAAARERELRCSAHAIGADPPILLGYRDSGMAGTFDNEHEDAFAAAPPNEVTGRLVQLIREHKPDVLITFDPNGGYGHPDHIAAHKAATRAYREAGNPKCFPQQLATLRPHAPGMLLYVAIPRTILRTLAAKLEAAGVPMGILENIEEIGTPDEHVHLEIDIAATYDAKLASLNCHATQINSHSPWRVLPPDDVRAVMAREYFTQVHPAPTAYRTCTPAEIFLER